MNTNTMEQFEILHAETLATVRDMMTVKQVHGINPYTDV